MDPIQEHAALTTRRQFFSRSAVGIGTAALSTLLDRQLPAAGSSPRGI